MQRGGVPANICRLSQLRRRRSGRQVAICIAGPGQTALGNDRDLYHRGTVSLELGKEPSQPRHWLHAMRDDDLSAEPHRSRPDGRCLSPGRRIYGTHDVDVRLTTHSVINYTRHGVKIDAAPAAAFFARHVGVESAGPAVSFAEHGAFTPGRT